MDRPSKRPRLDGPSAAPANMATPMEEEDDFADVYDESPAKPEISRPVNSTLHQQEGADLGLENIGTPVFSDTSELDNEQRVGPIESESTEKLRNTDFDTTFTIESTTTSHLIAGMKDTPGTAVDAQMPSNGVKARKDGYTQYNFDNSGMDSMEFGGEDQVTDSKAALLDDSQTSPSIPGLRPEIVDDEKKTVPIPDANHNAHLHTLERSNNQKQQPADTNDKPRQPELVDHDPGGSLVEAGAATGEFRFDSSDAQSSSTDDSSSSSSSSENSDDGAEDGEPHNLMSLEEQAKLLMAAEGDGNLDSDEENGKKGGSSGGQLRTQNELPDENVQKPDVTITPDMKIVELGSVESIVGKLILIKANVSGEYQVLEEGSVLCLADRTVVGVVADLLGRVQSPRYSVRFNSNEEIQETGISLGSAISYAEAFSTFVFTKPLQNMKGSDASNIYDEEVGAHEMEFSDDEAEAEQKRQIKLKRQGRRQAVGSGNGRARGHGPESNRPAQSDSNVLNYDEHTSDTKDLGDLDDDLYTPLARPPNYHELMNRPEGTRERRGLQGRGQRGDRGGRGRSDRGRGRGGRNRGSEHRDRYPRQSEDHHRRSGYGQGQERNEDRRGTFESSVNRTRANTEHSPRIPMDAMEYDRARSSNQHYHHPLAGHSGQHDIPPQSPLDPRPFHPGQQAYASTPPTPYRVQSHLHLQSGYGMGQSQPSTAFPVAPYAPAQSHYSPGPGAASVSHGPAGAYINPAFFDNRHTMPEGPWRPPSHQPPWPNQHPTQWSNLAFSLPDPARPGGFSSRMSPEAEAASRAAQEKLDILRSLTRGSGSPT
jgi:H/ACA ribonucleoprotein complex non-core subunit NAF1